MSEVVSKMFSRMSRMRPVPLEWAWQGLIPIGKLTLITGDRGVGKNLVALQVAAMMTRGVTRTPQTSDAVGSSAALSATVKPKRVPRRGVLVFSAVDQAEDTVLPRLTLPGLGEFETQGARVLRNESWFNQSAQTFLCPVSSLSSES